ncbi:hypothetical protein P171DRAFT_477354 [Karstenula rhodostoma CBS 690.94]|uniref:Uncharacterized protein n=1 Tax=Karstenula rhodostoma CBS 690.94 TaxID=1392251 RepID=A0A9P4P8L1_9PLEO|nr:hypothetical protein P171DRAFT_477354 [Karstenula rhodostoma CBS 690.94]
MRYAAGLLLFGCAAAQLQYGQYSDPPGESPTGSFITVTYMSSVYTIPIFDPSNAPTYGASKTTIYRPSETTESAKHSHSASSHNPASSAVASTREKSSTLETSLSPSSSAPSSVPPAPAEQTGGAASRIHSCGAGAVVGSVLAGIALM